MIISSDKRLWWDILKWDIADGVPDMKRGLYTFTICIGADLKNISDFTVIYDDFFGELDEDGELYRVIQKSLVEAINEMRDELYIKIDRADTNPNDFSVWFDKELVKRRYKVKIMKDISDIIREKRYNYKRTNPIDDFFDNMLNWIKGWFKKSVVIRQKLCTIEC